MIEGIGTRTRSQSDRECRGESEAPLKHHISRRQVYTTTVY